jgi:subtilisin family serine protease
MLKLTMEAMLAAVIIFVALAVYFMPKPDRGARLEYSRSIEHLEILPYPKLAAPVLKGPLQVIAVLDTGFKQWALEQKNVRFCKTGQYNALEDKKNDIGYDDNGHGTLMAYLAASKAQKVNYCILGIKIFDAEMSDDPLVIPRALKHLLSIKRLQVVSMSFAGPGFRFAEKAGLQALSLKGVVLLAAAGNSNLDMDKACSSYPACYDIPLLTAVGALSVEDNEQKAAFSNYGSKIKLWYPGVAYGMKGTSISCALAAGAYAAFQGGKE